MKFPSIYRLRIYEELAQWSEQRSLTPLVTGSNPVFLAIFFEIRGVSSIGRAGVSNTPGCGFNSRNPRYVSLFIHTLMT